MQCNITRNAGTFLVERIAEFERVDNKQIEHLQT